MFAFMFLLIYVCLDYDASCIMSSLLWLMTSACFKLQISLSLKTAYGSYYLLFLGFFQKILFKIELKDMTQILTKEDRIIFDRIEKSDSYYRLIELSCRYWVPLNCLLWLIIDFQTILIELSDFLSMATH